MDHVSQGYDDIEGSWILDSKELNRGGHVVLVNKIVLDFNKSSCFFRLGGKSIQGSYIINEDKRQLLVYWNTPMEEVYKEYTYIISNNTLRIYNFGQPSDLKVEDESGVYPVYVFRKVKVKGGKKGQPAQEKGSEKGSVPNGTSLSVFPSK